MALGLMAERRSFAAWRRETHGYVAQPLPLTQGALSATWIWSEQERPGMRAATSNICLIDFLRVCRNLAAAAAARPTLRFAGNLHPRLLLNLACRSLIYRQAIYLIAGMTTIRSRTVLDYPVETAARASTAGKGSARSVRVWMVGVDQPAKISHQMSQRLNLATPP